MQLSLPPSFVINFSNEDRKYYKKHYLKDCFDTKRSLSQVAIKDYNTLQEKCVYREELVKKLLTIFERALEKRGKKKDNVIKFKGIFKEFDVTVKKGEISFSCPFLEKTKKGSTHCCGVEKSEEKHFPYTFLIKNIANKAEIEVSGKIPHFILVHGFFGKVDPAKLIQVLDIKPASNFKPNPLGDKLGSSTEQTQTSEGSAEKPLKKPKPSTTAESTQPTKPQGVSVESPLIAHVQTPRPSANFPENPRTSIDSQSVKESSSSDEETTEEDCKCIIS